MKEIVVEEGVSEKLVLFVKIFDLEMEEVESCVEEVEYKRVWILFVLFL